MLLQVLSSCSIQKGHETEANRNTDSTVYGNQVNVQECVTGAATHISDHRDYDYRWQQENSLRHQYYQSQASKVAAQSV